MRWLVWGLAGAVVIIVAAVAWVGARALMAKNELEAVTPRVGELRSAVVDQNLGRLQQVAEEVGPHIRTAASLTDDPIWRATEAVPLLGQNLAAARIASAQLDTVVNRLALPLATELPRLARASGGIDTAVLRRVSATLTAADVRLRTAHTELDDARLDGVVTALADGVRMLREISRDLTPAVHDLAPFSRIAPQLLGADSPRRILLLVQNNAELRTGGGISGSFVELSVDKGRLSLVKVVSDAQFPMTGQPVATVPTSTTQLYGNTVGRHVQNTTMTADFAVTAALARAWWHMIDPNDPDIVMSIDPVVLASLLKATGPVDVAGATLNADNAVQQLLVNSYLELDEKDQDPFFAAAAATVFQRLITGGADPITLVQSLQQPVADGRISIWSAEANEQKVLASGALGGPSARQAAAGKNAYAIYFNDATASKMDSFLKAKITSGSAQCRTDGRRDVGVSVTLRSTAPADAATSLPGTVTGWGLSGTPAGDIRTVVSVAAPPGSFFGGVTVGDTRMASADVTDAGFPTTAATVLLKPGQEKTLQFRFIAAHPGDEQLAILHTPMMTDAEIASAPVTCG